MSAFRRNRKPYSRPIGGGNSDGQWQHDKAPGVGGRASFGSAEAKKAAIPVVPNTKLVVSNLHYEVTEQDLTKVFGQIGTLVRDPLIKYDRSGRSTGVAIVTFETATEAIRAKKQYNGILAKGQPMTIEFDQAKPRRVTSDPSSTLSLLNRVQKPPLSERLSNDDTAMVTDDAPSGGVGPIRNNPRRGVRGGGRGRGGRRGGGSGGGGLKKPKTAEELDKELDAFMVDSPKDAGAAPAPNTETVAAATTTQDVEMDL